MAYRRGCVAALLGVLLCTGIGGRPAPADPLPALPLDVRRDWQAVGLVNAAGYRGKASCSGTLIAPDLVLTAAHCAQPDTNVGHTRHFVAGWDRGSFAAHRKSKDVTVHPAYAVAKGDARFQYDVALIRLATPIAQRHIPSLRLSDAPGLRRGALAILGYHRQRPNVLNGRFDCNTGDTTRAEVFVLDCAVGSGNSGGPVLARTDDGWQQVGVVVARLGRDAPQALAVPIDDWIMDHWRAAMDRAAARPSATQQTQ